MADSEVTDCCGGDGSDRKKCEYLACANRTRSCMTKYSKHTHSLFIVRANVATVHELGLLAVFTPNTPPLLYTTTVARIKHHILNTHSLIESASKQNKAAYEYETV